ncbi:protein translocase subunit SecF [Nocardia sp. NPDC019395]|uniref:protein translocase subunit SecF n=1 Tax=Nocardia sp. NPDC019395 TaxID=3154686 RepID=UPI0033DCA954
MNSPVTMDKDASTRRSGAEHSWMNRLYTGTGVLDVIGNRRRWYMITTAIVLICLLSMVVRGFTFGIDFVGGSRIQMPAAGATTEQVEQVYSDVIGSDPESVQTVGTGDSATILIRSETLNAEELGSLQSELFDKFQPTDASGTPSRNAISASDVSETWGGQITRQAIIALLVFLVIVSVYIGFRYERDMAIAALAALVFDMLVTAGVYSLVGFEVTPAMVIGMLTILGFSLYDSVVVFDKVEENTRGVLHTYRRTYGEQANLAINQTLMRSFNTTLIGALPIIGLIVIAVWMLGVGTLQDLALVQLVGTVVGAYSSIFFATPLLVSIKERWGPVAAHTRKVRARRSGQAPVPERPRPAPRRRPGEPGADRDTQAPRRTGAAGPAPGARPTGKRQRRH